MREKCIFLKMGNYEKKSPKKGTLRKIVFFYFLKNVQNIEKIPKFAEKRAENSKSCSFF